MHITTALLFVVLAGQYSTVAGFPLDERACDRSGATQNQVAADLTQAQREMSINSLGSSYSTMYSDSWCNDSVDFLMGSDEEDAAEIDNYDDANSEHGVFAFELEDGDDTKIFYPNAITHGDSKATAKVGLTSSKAI
ncbi:hypothetical protein IWQ60_000065 [Tieghemiomyces parasiticus]|uniref:Uncharacterized protein n=1 Tax=Tieghemiomyces parasiticus TaxID=78921 RepID=A0A9W8DZI3_9FUNG|nr:hypothetical protein IWQ60_000065 [Tieghemiomyces parasiticus]